MHHTLPTSNYSHGSIETRDQSQTQPLYRELTSMLTGPIASQEGYWKTHGLILEEGRVQLVEHPGDDLELIGDVCREALWSSELSFKEKAQLALSAKKLFAERDLAFTGEPTLTLSVCQGDGTVTTVSLTLSESSRSDFFKKFWTSDCQESKKAQKNEEISIGLPDGVKIKDLFHYINNVDLETLSPDELSAVFILSEYFQDIDKAHRCIDLFPSLLPPSQADLENLLIGLPILIPELQNRYASLVMQKYIEVRMESGSSIQDIAETIERSPELKEALSRVSFDLKLGNFVSSSNDLILLASAIPNVHSLDLSYSYIDSLPLVWEDSLLHLDISHTKNITSIPHGFARLGFLSANQAKNLEDISGLNGSQFLKEIHLDSTAITSAPHDCTALEIFHAYGAEHLTDISGLNSLRALKKINVSYTAATSAPQGCFSLEIFNACGARRLSNISGLNGSQFLKKIDVGWTDITSAPQGCFSLEIFNACGARRLNNISGLNSSQFLKEIYLDSTAVTSAPYGCTALEQFTALFAYQLNDISGLNGSQFLKEIHLDSTAITSAPHDCTALEIFHAYGAEHLSDISGLNGSQFLKEINISETTVTSAPYGCTALEQFSANSAQHLSDISGLNGSRTLKEIYIESTAVTSAPHGCSALEIFNAFRARRLSNISGLSDSRALKYIDIRKTAVTTIPNNVRAEKIFR